MARSWEHLYKEPEIKIQVETLELREQCKLFLKFHDIVCALIDICQLFETKITETEK